MLKILIYDGCFIIFTGTLNDKVITDICENCLDDHGITFERENSQITVKSNLYQALFNLSAKYDMTTF